MTSKVDVAIIGAGIVGLAHAFLAARSGRTVAVFERNPAAFGASIRNFGMIWPIGQPAGPMHLLALRSRELWLEMLSEAGLPCFETGSLHATYRDDEAAVGQEFSRIGPTLGYDCTWLTTDQALARSQALRGEGLLGALWSPTELTVDPRQIVRSLPRFLAERYGVEFHFNCAVQRVESSTLHTADMSREAASIIVAGGDDFQTLFPDCFSDAGLTRCKLQMMRIAAQPDGWQLGPSLAFGPQLLARCPVLPCLPKPGEGEHAVIWTTRRAPTPTFAPLYSMGKFCSRFSWRRLGVCLPSDNRSTSSATHAASSETLTCPFWSASALRSRRPSNTARVK